MRQFSFTLFLFIMTFGLEAPALAGNSEAMQFSLSNNKAATKSTDKGGWEMAASDDSASQCTINKYIGGGTFLSLSAADGAYALQVENSRDQFDVWKDYPVTLRMDGTQKAMAIRPIKYDTFVIPLSDGEPLINTFRAAKNFDIGIGDRHYVFAESKMKSVVAKLDKCAGVAVSSADTSSKITPAAGDDKGDKTKQDAKAAAPAPASTPAPAMANPVPSPIMDTLPSTAAPAAIDAVAKKAASDAAASSPVPAMTMDTLPGATPATDGAKPADNQAVSSPVPAPALAVAPALPALAATPVTPPVTPLPGDKAVLAQAPAPALSAPIAAPVMPAAPLPGDKGVAAQSPAPPSTAPIAAPVTALAPLPQDKAPATQNPAPATLPLAPASEAPVPAGSDAVPAPASTQAAAVPPAVTPIAQTPVPDAVSVPEAAKADAAPAPITPVVDAPKIEAGQTKTAKKESAKKTAKSAPIETPKTAEEALADDKAGRTYKPQATPIPSEKPLKAKDLMPPPSQDAINAQKAQFAQSKKEGKPLMAPLAEKELPPVKEAVPVQPEPAPVEAPVPVAEPAAQPVVADGETCASSDQYKNLVRKIGLLEIEKEKLRSTVSVNDMAPALQKVTQCASESFMIKELKTEVDILKKENADLRRQAEAVKGVDNLNDALNELDETVKNGKK